MKYVLAGYWVLLFTATHYPRVRIPGEIPSSDKLVHFAAFAILAVLWSRTFERRSTRFFVGSTVGLVAYAGLDEWLQQFFGRYTDVNDFIANALGVLVAMIAIRAYRYIRTSPRSRPGSDTSR